MQGTRALRGARHPVATLHLIQHFTVYHTCRREQEVHTQETSSLPLMVELPDTVNSLELLINVRDVWLKYFLMKYNELHLSNLQINL